MIFLVLFGLIAAIVISLNIYDNSNKEEIKNFFETQKCETIIYSKGKYKGVCHNYVMQISNSFNVDLRKNRTTLLYKDIKDVKIEKNSIIINETYNIEFANEENKEIFYRNLRKKINK